MTPEVLVSALKRWLTKKDFRIEQSNDPKEVIFKCSNGHTHRVFFSDLDDKHGAIATDSRFAGQVLQQFTKEVMGDDVSVMKTEMRMDHGENGHPKDILRQAMKEGPEAVKELLEKNGAKVIDDPMVELENIYSELVKSADESGDQEKIDEVKKLGKLLQIAKIVDEIKSESDGLSGLSFGMKQFKRLEKSGKTLPPIAMKKIKVGDKFFDKDYNLNVAVGFEQGTVGGEYVNSVIVEPNGEDEKFFSGLPVKRELKERVIPIKF